jgi:hypothetical protein
MTGSISSSRGQSDRRFYRGIAWIIGVLVTAVFSKAVILNHFEPGALSSPLVQAHAFVFSSWIVLFVVQANLISAKRPDIHRKLGAIGVILICAIVLLSVVSAFRVFALGMELYFFANPHIEVIVFVMLTVPAFIFRRNAELHKRLVLLGTISLIGAATAHLPFIGYISKYAYLIVQDLFIVACIVYDFTSRRLIHHAYIWGGILIVVSQCLIIYLSTVIKV